MSGERKFIERPNAQGGPGGLPCVAKGESYCPGFLGPKGQGYSGSVCGSLNFAYCIRPSTGTNCRISRPSPSGIIVWLYPLGFGEYRIGVSINVQTPWPLFRLIIIPLPTRP